MTTTKIQNPFIIRSRVKNIKNITDWKKYVWKPAQGKHKIESPAQDHDKILYGA